MRTTLDIADDVLQAAKERARRDKTSLGQVISDLARQALTGGVAGASRATGEERAVYGFKPFSRRGGIVTNELIDRLRDDDVY